MVISSTDIIDTQASKIAIFTIFLWTAAIFTSRLVIVTSHPHIAINVSTFSLSQENVFEAAFQGKRQHLSHCPGLFCRVTRFHQVAVRLLASLSLSLPSAGRCAQHNPCEQLCFDLHDGTFECTCFDNYFLSDNGYSCIFDDHSYEDTIIHSLDAAEQSDQETNVKQSTPMPTAFNPASGGEDEEDSIFSHETSDTNENSSEEPDLDQFSSSKSNYFNEKREPALHLHEENSNKYDDNNGVESQSIDRIANTNEILEKEKRKIDKNSESSVSTIHPHVRQYNGYHFNFCSQIECEAGGICVEEEEEEEEEEPEEGRKKKEMDHSHRDASSLPLMSSESDGRKKGRKVAPRTSNTHRSRVRCRCPLGRKGFLCEKRKW